MAKEYCEPEGYEIPKYNYELSHEENIKIEELAVKRLSDWCKQNSKCPDAGEIIRFQIADGYAEYMVMDYRRLIYLSNCEYSIPEAHVRGLLKKDIVEKIGAEKSLRKLFKSRVK